MIEVNLVPDVKQELLRAQRIRSSVVAISILICIAVAAIVVVLAIYVFVGQTVRDRMADDSITREAQTLSSVEDLSKTLTIQNQLSQLPSQYDSKKINSRIFSVLTAIIPPEPNEVRLSTVAIDTDNEILTIEGQAVNSYEAVETFKKTIDAAQVRYRVDGEWQEVKMASNITTGDTSYGEDSTGNKVLRFSLSFTYASELLAATSSEATIFIGTTGNVTDSYLGVPESIFTDRATDLEEE